MSGEKGRSMSKSQAMAKALNSWEVSLDLQFEEGAASDNEVEVKLSLAVLSDIGRTITLEFPARIVRDECPETATHDEALVVGLRHLLRELERRIM